MQGNSIKCMIWSNNVLFITYISFLGMGEGMVSESEPLSLCFLNPFVRALNRDQKTLEMSTV